MPKKELVRCDSPKMADELKYMSTIFSFDAATVAFEHLSKMYAELDEYRAFTFELLYREASARANFGEAQKTAQQANPSNFITMRPPAPGDVTPTYIQGRSRYRSYGKFHSLFKGDSRREVSTFTTNTVKHPSTTTPAIEFDRYILDEVTEAMMTGD